MTAKKSRDYCKLKRIIILRKKTTTLLQSFKMSLYLSWCKRGKINIQRFRVVIKETRYHRQTLFNPLLVGPFRTVHYQNFQM